MKLNRREILKGSLAIGLFGGCSAIGTSHERDSEGNEHDHPHTSSHTPVHFFVNSFEHAFLFKDSERYASMRGCHGIFHHGRYLDSSDHRFVRSYFEDVPFFVNSNNPVKNLSGNELAAIFRGEVLNWKQLGGDSGEIKLVTRGGLIRRQAFVKMISTCFFEANDSITSRLMLEYVVDYDPLELGKSSITKNKKLNVSFVNSYEEVSKEVERDHNAIAVSLRPSYSEPLRLLRVDDNKPGQKGYYATVPTYLTCRRDVWSAYPKSKKIVRQLDKKYSDDKTDH